MAQRGGIAQKEATDMIEIHFTDQQISRAVLGSFDYASEHAFEMFERWLSNPNLTREGRADLIDYIYGIAQYSLTDADVTLFPPTRPNPLEKQRLMGENDEHYQERMRSYDERLEAALASAEAFDITLVSQESREAFKTWMRGMETGRTITAEDGARVREPGLENQLTSLLEQAISTVVQGGSGSVPFSIGQYSNEQIVFADIVFDAFNESRAMQPPADYIPNENRPLSSKRYYSQEDRDSDHPFPIRIEFGYTDVTIYWSPWIRGQTYSERGDASTSDNPQERQ